jgi:hypothetical protein
MARLHCDSLQGPPEFRILHEYEGYKSEHVSWDPELAVYDLKII